MGVLANIKARCHERTTFYLLRFGWSPAWGGQSQARPMPPDDRCVVGAPGAVGPRVAALLYTVYIVYFVGNYFGTSEMYIY